MSAKRPTRIHCRLFISLAAAFLGAAVVSPAAGLAEPRAAGEPRAVGEPAYTEEQRITAVDTMVEILSRKGGPSEAPVRLPTYLSPDDFEVVDQGERRRVIDVEAFGPAQHHPDAEPWTFVIYFDRALAGPAETSWAAGELLAVAGRLTDLGRVEVVVADPEPSTVLEPTRESELLGSVLAEIALFPEGEDHRLLALRDEFLGEVGKAGSEIDPVELAAFAVSEERRIVARQVDALLTRMASTEAGARRGLLLVSSGFDLSPEDFYRAHRPAPKPIAAASEDPESVAEALARSLAAYGWITFPVVPTDDELQAGGLWLGQWRLGGPEGAVRETAVDPLHPEETVGQAMLNLLDLTRSGRRDPEKAEAYLELGATLAAEGDREEAEQALRLALHHLGEDPATADKQVEALLALADVLDSGGRRREARAILERARKLDAESAVAGRPLAELLDPIRPFERLAEATGGQVVRSREALLESLAGLPWRVRLTFQVSGAADGSLHPVEIRCLRRGCRARATAWIRSGTPREVAAARIRRWLADDQFEGDLAVEARLAPAGDAIELEVGIPPGGSMAAPPGGPGGSPAAPADLRVTLGEGDPESIGELRHQVEVPRLLSDPMRWGLSVALSRRIDPRPAGAVAVLVDHLESGRWGATLVERPEKLSDR